MGPLEQIRSLRKSRFARDALFLQIGSGVSMAANVVTSVGLFRILGVDETGRYFEAINIFTLMFFLSNIGLAQVTVARVSESVGRGDHAAIGRGLGMFLKGYWHISLGLFVLSLGLGPVLGVAFRVGADAGWWAAWLGVTAPLMTPFYLVQCALQSTRRMRLLAEMENLKEMMRAYLVLVCAILVGRPEGAIFGELAAAAASCLLAYLAYSKARREEGPELPAWSELRAGAAATKWSEIRTVIRSGFVLSLQKNFTALAPTVLPRLMLAYYSTSREVAYLNLAQNLMKIPLTGLQGVSRTLVPALGALRGSGRYGEMRKALIRIMLLSGGTITAATALWGVALYWIIPIFYGEALTPALALIPWFFVCMSIAGFAVGVEAYYLVTNQLHISGRAATITFFGSLPIGLWTVSRWHLTGAAMYIFSAHLCAAYLIAYALLSARRLAAADASAA